LAETQAVAQLIGSVVAECAFEEGSYRMLSYNREDSSFDEILHAMEQTRVSILPIHDTLFNDKDLSNYIGLERLGYLATVDELAGVFRLPVASITSPKCIAKNTDPEFQNGTDLILVGYDLENPSISIQIPHPLVIV